MTSRKSLQALISESSGRLSEPVITVLLYWFVFEFGLHQKASDLRTGIEIPFVMWLMAGLVPWFYFQEAMNGGRRGAGGVQLSCEEGGLSDRYASGREDDIGIVYASVFCGVCDRGILDHGVSSGSVYIAGDLLFGLHDRVYDGDRVCDRRGHRIFPRYERGCGDPAPDRYVGHADHVEL